MDMFLLAPIISAYVCLTKRHIVYDMLPCTISMLDMTMLVHIHVQNDAGSIHSIDVPTCLSKIARWDGPSNHSC
jgi:hypothetical protein